MLGCGTMNGFPCPSRNGNLALQGFAHGCALSDGSHWYCRVRRGNEKTRPMGPYTKQQAERILEARRTLIAKRGAARIMFE